jgi:lipopolysaccharide transport system ATP-binding protein
VTEPIAVAARGLTKEFRLYSGAGARILEWLGGRSRHTLHRALDGVDFEQRKGEGIAILGENGAGKSTLLKLVAGVTLPTAGTLEVDGRTAAILELGSGFHPEFTGRQNIRLNAALLGLTSAEIRAREAEIVAWSELGDSIDRPVREYSSGMTMRLGFSIATQVDPDVLIVDEALSVGDGYFQKKSMDRMVAFVESGGTLLFCSHALYLVSAFCARALWLRHGKVAAFGGSAQVIAEYERYLMSRQREADAEGETVAPAGAGAAFVTGVRARGGAGETASWRTGDDASLEIELVTDDATRAVHVGVLLEAEDGTVVATFATHTSLDGEALAGRTEYRVELQLLDLPLLRGSYDLVVLLLDERGLHVYDRRRYRRMVAVEGPRFDSGLVRIPCRWKLP